MVDQLPACQVAWPLDLSGSFVGAGHSPWTARSAVRCAGGDIGIAAEPGELAFEAEQPKQLTGVIDDSEPSLSGRQEELAGLLGREVG